LNPASTPPGGSGATVGGPIPVGAFVNGAFQNSWNLGMNFLSGGGFNPCAPGEYDFRLVAYQGYNEVASSAIRVVVAAAPPSVPDGGSTLLLVGLALSAVVAVNRRQRV
jgi:VPDSG-CTERM motif